MAEQAEKLVSVSRDVWELAELALKEDRSSKLLADYLEAEGFAVTRGVSGMPTAFVASYGEGKPVVAYLAEYDALPGLSQRAEAHVVPLEKGANGHGCGHNLFGRGSVGAGIALKSAMEAHGLKGTVRVYGTPAEEHGIGKVFMVRDGLFDDVDACLSWHPSDENEGVGPAVQGPEVVRGDVLRPLGTCGRGTVARGLRPGRGRGARNRDQPPA